MKGFVCGLGAEGVWTGFSLDGEKVWSWWRWGVMGLGSMSWFGVCRDEGVDSVGWWRSWEGRSESLGHVYCHADLVRLGVGVWERGCVWWMYMIWRSELVAVSRCRGGCEGFKNLVWTLRWGFRNIKGCGTVFLGGETWPHWLQMAGSEMSGLVLVLEAWRGAICNLVCL